ncbi:MAG: hypothetical protein IT443_09130 [Phycisphaeraceae bacterium]|nr:hypothetical protein [Phycisphaeraceae bacterium]
MSANQVTSETSPLLFHEEQRFTQWWLRVAVAAVNIAAVIVLYEFWTGRLENGVGNLAPPLNVLLGSLMMTTWLIGPLTLFILLFSKLTTQVRADGLYIRFRPFHWRWRRMELEKVTQVRAVTYSALVDYGGWGLRWVPGGAWAYNVKGNQGVRLDCPGMRHILIGSQRAEELAAAVHKIWSRSAASTKS